MALTQTSPSNRYTAFLRTNLDVEYMCPVARFNPHDLVFMAKVQRFRQIRLYTEVVYSITHFARGVEAFWSPLAGSALLVASANPSSRQYQPANTDLLDSGYLPSSAYHASSPQPLDPFFDVDDDAPDSALVRPIPMQSTESHLHVAIRRSFAKCCASGVGSTRVWC